MKLCVVADVHLGCFAQYGGEVVDGLNARARLTLKTLEAAVNVAAAAGAKLVVAGDLFQVKRPEPALIAAAQRVLETAVGARPLLLLGNHDAIGPGDTALAPLWQVAQPITAPHCDAGVLYVPWSPAPALARIESAFATSGSVPVRLVVMHCGIYDGTFPEYLRGDGAVGFGDLVRLGCAHGVRLFIAGDYHRHRVFEDRGVQAVQVGALNPTGFSDEGTEGYGSVIVVDPETGAWERREIPGPRFLAMDYTEADREKRINECRAAGNTVFARLRVPAGAEAEVRGGPFCEWLEQEGVAYDFDPDEAESPAPVETRPRVRDFDEVLVEYVTGMALPAGVTAEAVLGAARRFVG